MTPLKLAVMLQAPVGGLLLNFSTGVLSRSRAALLSFFFVFHISRWHQVTPGCYRVALNVCGFLFCGFSMIRKNVPANIPGVINR